MNSIFVSTFEHPFIPTSLQIKECHVVEGSRAENVAEEGKDSKDPSGIVFFDEQIYGFSEKERKVSLKNVPSRITLHKFTQIALASSLGLCSLVHLIRSVCFFWQGKYGRAGRSFIGAFGYPPVAIGCFIGALSAYGVTFIDEKNTFYIRFRRVFGYFEAWVNGIDLLSPDLSSFSRRVSFSFLAIIPRETSATVWTAALCMQPFFEKGVDLEKGLKNVGRVISFLDGDLQENKCYRVVISKKNPTLTDSSQKWYADISIRNKRSNHANLFEKNAGTRRKEELNKLFRKM